MVPRLPKKFAKLDDEELEDLLDPIRPIDFKIAAREHSLGYLHLINRKIVALRDISRLGKDISQVKLNFSAAMDYITLLDFASLLDEHIRMKDEFLYYKYAINVQPCLDCEIDGDYKSLCIDCMEKVNENNDNMMKSQKNKIL